MLGKQHSGQGVGCRMVIIGIAISLSGCQDSVQCDDAQVVGVYRICGFDAPERTKMAATVQFDFASEDWWNACDPRQRLYHSQLKLDHDHTFLFRNPLLSDSVGVWEREESEGYCMVRLIWDHVPCQSALRFDTSDTCKVVICGNVFKNGCSAGAFMYTRDSRGS